MRTYNYEPLNNEVAHFIAEPVPESTPAPADDGQYVLAYIWEHPLGVVKDKEGKWVIEPPATVLMTGLEPDLDPIEDHELTEARNGQWVT